MDAINFFINNFLSDNSSSSEDDEENNTRSGRRTRINNFEDVIDSYSDDEFRRDFRVTRSTFSYILSMIGNQIENSYGNFGRNTLSAKKQLYIALWYFATPDSYRSFCKKFDVGNATAFGAVHRITDALLLLSGKVISWPTGSTIDIVQNGFAKLGFPDTIGCIDGCYIRIPMPQDEETAYICRKNCPAIILQAVCDHTIRGVTL